MSESRKHPDMERLQAYVEESLDPGGRAQMDAHLSACADCRGEVEALRGVFTALSKLTLFAPEAGFGDRVMAGVHVQRPAFAGADAWLERLVPSTTRGWAAAAALLALPVIGVTLLVSWLVSQPGVTTQGLWLIASDWVGQALSSGWQWAWTRFAGTTLAGWLAQGLELVNSVGRGEIGLAAVLFATLTAGSIYVLYQNLFRPDARRTEHATYVF